MAAALALFTSAAYGVANYLGPRLARDAPILLLLTISQGASLVLAGLLVAASGDAPPDAGALGWALLAGLGNATGLIFFYRAAQIGPLSIVTSVGSIGVAIPVAVGLAGDESVVAAQVAGMVLAVSGLLLVSRRPPAGLAPAPADDHHLRREAIGLALIATVGFGLFLAAIKPASEDGAVWAVFVSRASLVAVLVVMAAREGVLSRTPVRKVALLTVPGVLLFAGTLSYAAATRRGDLSVVSVLSSLFTIVTVTLAVTLDQERLPRIAWAGVVAAIAGVVLLSAH